MRQTGGGFGYVLVIAVLVVLLLLSVRDWRNAAPAAAQALKPGASATVPEHGRTEAGREVRSGTLPNMKKTGENTDSHVQEINEITQGRD